MCVLCRTFVSFLGANTLSWVPFLGPSCIVRVVWNLKHDTLADREDTSTRWMETILNSLPGARRRDGVIVSNVSSVDTVTSNHGRLYYGRKELHKKSGGSLKAWKSSSLEFLGKNRLCLFPFAIFSKNSKELLFHAFRDPPLIWPNSFPQ